MRFPGISVLKGRVRGAWNNPRTEMLDRSFTGIGRKLGLQYGQEKVLFDWGKPE